MNRAGWRGVLLWLGLGLGFVILVDVTSRGCAIVPVRIRLVGRVVDAAGRPVSGAEVLAVDAGVEANERDLERWKAWARDEARSHESSDTTPAFRECRLATTDHQGRYDLTVIWAHGRPTSLISRWFESVRGRDTPPLERWAVVVVADGAEREVTALEGGELRSLPRNSAGQAAGWRYELARISLRP
jgi:hypothetical protein